MKKRLWRSGGRGVDGSGCSASNPSRVVAGGHLSRRLVLVLPLAALLCLAGCLKPVEPPVLVGLSPWIGYDPLVLARERSLLDPALVKVVELSSNTEVQRNFRNGLIGAAAMTLDEALRLVDDGVELKVVAVVDESAGADVVLARPGITHPEQLRGKKIAADHSTVSSLVLDRLLQAGGLRPSDVEVVRIESSQHLLAIRSELVDAVVSYEPLASAVRAEGFAPIFDSVRMPGEIVDVLVVRSSVLATSPDQVDALLRAWAYGLLELERDVSGAAQMLGPGVDLTPADYEDRLKGLRFVPPAASLALLEGQPPRLVPASEALIQVLKRMGLLAKSPQWDALIDADPARRTAGSGAAP